MPSYDADGNCEVAYERGVDAVSSVDEERTARLAKASAAYADEIFEGGVRSPFSTSAVIGFNRGWKAALESVSPRLVTSVEELDALPAGTIILDSEPSVSERSRDDLLWLTTGNPTRWVNEAMILPATVLWSPAPEGSPESSEPCEEEINSWDYFKPEQIDQYQLRCDLTGEHADHKNSSTGARWSTVPAGSGR